MKTALLALLFLSTLACAYPDRPVTVIVPHPIATAPDVAARVVADTLSASLNRPFVVMNRPGFANAIGAAEVAKARADGYTLMVAGTGPVIINKLTVKDLSYDRKDFVAVYSIGRVPNVIVARPSFPGNDMAEVIAAAKSGRVTLATSGSRNMHDAQAHAIFTAAGADFVAVPYKGVAQALMDVQEGRVDLFANDHAGVKAQIAAGTVKPISLTYPGWVALFAPAGTPQDIIALLNETLRRELYVSKIEAIGFVAEPKMNPQQLKAVYDKEDRTWHEIFDKSGIKPQ